MGLQRFERRLERLVEGTFSKAFRGGGLQPVEIGRRVGRQMDTGRTLGVRGTVAPNKFTIWLSRDDLERFSGFHDALARELADAVLFFSSRRRHTSYWRDWSSDVCSSDLQATSPPRPTMPPAIGRPPLT